MFKTHAVQTIGASEHEYLHDNVKFILYYPIYRMPVEMEQLSESSRPLREIPHSPIPHLFLITVYKKVYSNLRPHGRHRLFVCCSSIYDNTK